MGLRMRVGPGAPVKLFGYNRFGAPCAVSGEWVDAGAGWRAKIAGRWVTVSNAIAAERAVPVVVDMPNDRPESCWYCGGVVEPRAGVLMVDASSPRETWAALHRDCAPFIRAPKGDAA